MKVKLTSIPTRKDMRDRECAVALEGLCCGLALMSSPEEVRNAVRFIAQDDDIWKSIQQLHGTNGIGAGEPPAKKKRGK